MADNIKTNEVVKKRWIMHLPSGLVLAMKSDGRVILDLFKPQDLFQQWEFRGEIEARGTIQNAATDMFLYPVTGSTPEPQAGQLLKGRKDKPEGLWDNSWFAIIGGSASYQTLCIEGYNLWITSVAKAGQDTTLTIESPNYKIQHFLSTPEVPATV